MHGDAEVHDRHLVLMRQQVEEHQRHGLVAAQELHGDARDGQRHILALVRSRIELLVRCLVKHTLAGARKVLKLEDTRVVQRQALLHGVRPHT
jgi:hypothetical protein